MNYVYFQYATVKNADKENLLVNSFSTFPSSSVRRSLEKFHTLGGLMPKRSYYIFSEQL